MHTLESRFLYPEAALRGAISGQHPNRFHNSLHSLVHGAVRFLFWWLFLHRRLRARQRGSHLSMWATWHPIGWSLPMGVIRFYPDNRKNLSTLPASLSASTLAFMSSGFPLLLPSNDASPHPFHLQVPVKTPVSNFDCVMDCTFGNFRVKYKVL